MNRTSGNCYSSNVRTDYIKRGHLEMFERYDVYSPISNRTEPMVWNGIMFVTGDGRLFYHYDENPRLGEVMPMRKTQ